MFGPRCLWEGDGRVRVAPPGGSGGFYDAFVEPLGVSKRLKRMAVSLAQ